MNEADKKLAAHLLELASDSFSNHGCNDLLLTEFMTQEQADDFRRRYHEWNGDPENFEEGRQYFEDFAAMSFLADLIAEG